MIFARMKTPHTLRRPLPGIEPSTYRSLWNSKYSANASTRSVYFDAVCCQLADELRRLGDQCRSSYLVGCCALKNSDLDLAETRSVRVKGVTVV